MPKRKPTAAHHLGPERDISQVKPAAAAPEKPPPKRAHTPVLLAEVQEILKVEKGDVVVDCTVGLGGHAVPLLKAAGKKGRLIGLDLDPENLEMARESLAKTKLPFDLVHSNFAGLPAVLAERGIPAADAILADLGVSSTQIDRRQRGFSFLRTAPLDMRMNPTRGKTAAELLSTISRIDLANALRELGDEPDADAIAGAIMEARNMRPIDTTGRLTAIVCRAKGLPVPERGWGRLHPAALAFQAIRMLVNRELPNLEALLAVLPLCLAPGGRAAIISFHSGEDRLVKASFKAGLERGLYSVTSKDAVRVAEEESASNARSWSARLRWAVRAD